jgi:hypothetical protein
MSKTTGIIFGLLIMAVQAWAAPKQLAPNDVSASNLKSVLSERYGTSIDDDGMVIVKKGEYLRINIQINPKDKVLVFFHGWSAKPSSDKMKCLEKVNRWNLDRAFNCVTYNHEDRVFIWCYYLAFTGGVDTTNLLDTVGVLFENEEVFVKDFYEAGLLE